MKDRMGRTGKAGGRKRARALAVVGSTLVLLFSFLGGGPRARAGGGCGSREGTVRPIRVCVLPFVAFEPTETLRRDLAVLVETRLAGRDWIELIPVETTYEPFYEMSSDPWLIKGIWDERGEGREAEAYFGMRRRWLEKVEARFPSDYLVLGNLLQVGGKRILQVEVIASGTERAAYEDAGEVMEPSKITKAVETLAEGVATYLLRRHRESVLAGLRGLYWGRICSLEAAVAEAEAITAEYPRDASFRMHLLSLYEEAPSRYGGRAARTAAAILRLWPEQDGPLKGLMDKLGVDPFLVLCRTRAAKGDWRGVKETCRRAIEKNPLRATEYERWLRRAEEEVKKTARAKTGPGARP